MMTLLERRRRAEHLLLIRVVGEAPADKAWRVVKPNSKCKDFSAGELTRRELRWLRDIQARDAEERRALNQHFIAPFNIQSSSPPISDSESDAPSEPAPPPKMKRCEGVAGRQCEQEVPAVRNQRRCKSCAKENRKLQKRGYGREYYRDNRVRLCKDLRHRRNGTLDKSEEGWQRFMQKPRYLTEEGRKRHLKQLVRELRKDLALTDVLPADGTRPDTLLGSDDRLYKYNKKTGEYERTQWGQE